MKTVILHGKLKEIVGHDQLQVDAESVVDILNWLSHQFPQLQPVPGQERMKVRAIGYRDMSELASPTNGDEVHLVPDFHGGKNGMFNIIIGALVIGATLALGPYGAGLLFMEGMWITAGTMYALGASLILGGLLQLISPSPNADVGDQQVENSRYLGVPKNTVKIGTRIPILYGEHIIYGHYLSFDIDAVDVQPEGGAEDDTTVAFITSGANSEDLIGSTFEDEITGEGISPNYSYPADWSASIA